MSDTVLIQLVEGTYLDQYGIEHECWMVTDEVLLTPTGETVDYQYYTEIIKDPIYIAADGRRFRCHVATDYGCPSTWEWLGEDGGPVRVERNGKRARWVRYYGPPKVGPAWYFSNRPVIDPKRPPLPPRPETSPGT